MVLEMNEAGEILQTLHDPDGELVTAVSQASTLKDGRMVMGSFFSDWLSISKETINAIGDP